MPRGGARPGTGGRRPGSGRKPGTPNKASAKREAEVAASGETPLQYMLRVMRDKKAPEARRDEMAKAAGPYVHSRLTAVQMSGGLTMTHEQALEKLK